MPKRRTKDKTSVTMGEDNESCVKKSKLGTDGASSTKVPSPCNTGSSKINCDSGEKHQSRNETIPEGEIKVATLASQTDSTSPPESARPVKRPSSSSRPNSPPPPNRADDREYFDSYSHLDIHRTMIDDAARTQAYRRAILTNYSLFYGKTVLDVGSGTGILSVFCCQAGARCVYAVEASGAAEFARQVAAENGYADRVQVLQCRVEEASLPERVDVIVSEWMGHALLYESMLESVLAARDRWLRPGGAMFPERAVLEVALCTAPELALETDAAEFWRGVHGRFGVHMSCLASEGERRRWTGLPARVTSLQPEEVHSHPVTLVDLDLLTVPAEKVRQPFTPDASLLSFGRAELTGLALWFNVFFPGGEKLGTSPYDTPTHWGQTVLPLEPIVVDQDTVIRCPMNIEQDEKHPRNWRFYVLFAVHSGEGGPDDVKCIDWVMDGTG